MVNFPRATRAKSRLSQPPRFPAAMQDWSQAGAGTFRSTVNIGRVWEEVYPVLDPKLPAVRALIAAINQSLREGTLWDVQVPYWHNRTGVGGGSPLVNGADQTGSNLVIDGASSSITNWLRAGDMIEVTGGVVIYDVTGNVNTDGGGNATIPINPPIFSGQSPANNAPVEIDPAQIYFKAHIVDVSDFPDIDADTLLGAGLTLVWRESPQ